MAATPTVTQLWPASGNLCAPAACVPRTDPLAKGKEPEISGQGSHHAEEMGQTQGCMGA